MLSQVEKFEILNKRSSILCKVNNYIDDKSIREIISSIETTEDDYYWALSISPDTDSEIHLKGSPGSYFVNNYNPVLLKKWEVNLDIQPVHNYYEALTYMTDYFSKSERNVSEVLRLTL